MLYICRTVGLLPGVSAGDIVDDEDERVRSAIEQYPAEFEPTRMDGEE